jgi:ABC-2 type transport system ATP-binding protein
LSDWRVDTRRELVFVGYGPRQRAAVEALSPDRVEIVEMNLEDAFIEYTRGPRRPLPIFSHNQGESQGGQADEGIGVQGAA